MRFSCPDDGYHCFEHESLYLPYHRTSISIVKVDLTIRSLAAFAASILIIVCAPTAQSQTPSELEKASIQLALDRGQLLYAFDQAAWHATDKFIEDAKAGGRLDALRSKFGGWIVRQSDHSTLEVIFFSNDAVTPKELYVVQMSGSGTHVVSGRFAGQDAVITEPKTLQLIRAREAALQAIEGQSILRCKKQPFNVAVLPPDTPDGSIPVYVLTPQSDLDHVPFGGHLRVMVSADGEAGALHPFTKSCMDLPTRRAKDAPKALVATQLIDPLPTEVAVFTMFAAQLPLFILTRDKRTWVIETSGGQGRVRLLPDNLKRH